MNKSTKQLFGAPWKAEEYEHGKGAFVVRNNGGYLVAENMSEQDAKRTARLPELYDALIYAVHDKCSSCGFAVATNPVDFCKDCKYKTFTDLLLKVKNASFREVDPADEDSLLSQQKEDLTLDPQITEPQEVSRTYYTSYVSNIKNLPPDIVPVVFDYLYDDAGIRYRKLAPTFASYHWWKNKHHDNNIYAEEYKQLILDRLDPLLVRDELLTMANGKTFCLVSEEKPGEFSLRHIVAEWMRKAGIDIQEYQNTSITH